MKRLLIGISLLCIGAGSLLSLQAQSISGDQILQKIDANLIAKNRVITSKMLVHTQRHQRVLEAKSWIQGREKSFSEYLAPAREKGTKMLKLKDQLWLYSPSTDRTIRISGHMLRQSLMGSDLSYEDMLEDKTLHKRYTAAVIGTETINERPCWVLELTANRDNITYASRKIWVDKTRYLPMQEYRYAKSGKLLKTTEVKTVMKVQNRWTIKHIVFKDALKKGKGTEFIVSSIQYNVKIPRHLFSKASLRK